MYLIGERINGMFKDVREAIQTKNESFIKDLVLKQIESGADALDISVGPSVTDPIEAMEWIVTTVRKISDITLAIDTTKYDVMEKGISMAGVSKGIINSVVAEEKEVDRYVDLAKKYNSKIIGLTMTQKGVPKTSLERVELAAFLMNKFQENNILPEEIFIDSIILPLNVAQDQCYEVLETISQIKILTNPPCRTILGLSNVSQKCSNRSIINRTFLSMAISRGLDSVIMDVNDQELVNEMVTAEMLLNRQIYCENYLSAYKKKNF